MIARDKNSFLLKMVTDHFWSKVLKYNKDLVRDNTFDQIVSKLEYLVIPKDSSHFLGDIFFGDTLLLIAEKIPVHSLR